LSHIYEDDQAIDQLANDDMYEHMLREERVEKLRLSICALVHEPTRLILLEMLELIR